MRPHESAVRSYLRSRFPSLDQDDVVQESYLKLLKLRAAGKIASAKAYFIVVARNTALTFFRRERIYTEAGADEMPAWRILDEGANPAEAANSQHRLDLAVEAIERLPGRCREIFRLAVLERLAADEIAVRLGLAQSTVHVQLARGVKKCAEYLRERGECL